MKKLFAINLLFLLFVCGSLMAQQKPALSWKDVSKWSYNRQSSLSANGDWIGVSTGPVEGDLQAIIRKTTDTTHFSYPIGASATSVVFSKDSKYAAFKVSAKESEVKAAKKTPKVLYDKLMIVSLPGNEKTTFEKVKTFSFSGDAATWIAIQFAPSETAAKGPTAPKGTDVLLYNMSTKKSFNLGNVSEFSFNKAGTQLVYIVDAAGQNGNGVFIRNMNTGLIAALDNDKATYKQINWTEEGDAFALLKSNKNEKYKEDVFTVLGFSKIDGDNTAKVMFSGIDESGFPTGMGLSGNGNAYWSDDRSNIFVGINKLDKKEAKKDSTAKEAKTTTPAAASKSDIEKPDMIIWNWQDKRLQSAQQVQESRDKNFSYLAVYNVATKKFTQLADSNVRNVSIVPMGQYALGSDNSEYELMSNLDGQSYNDIYLIDVKTGAKKLLLKKYYQTAGGGFSAAPNGKMAVFYKDGVFYSMNLETGQEYNLTGGIQSSFVNALDDHNVMKPATQVYGWTADSKYVLIKDNNDLWKISADGKSVTALTNNWKATDQMVQSRSRIYRNEKGIDLTKPQYFTVFNSATKKEGFGVLEAGKNEIKVLFMDDYAFNTLTKAENGPGFIYTKENFANAPDYYYTTSAKLENGKKVTSNTPDQQKYAWTAGVKLIDYVSANGDKLQAAIYLPANYEPGKSYPAITYIYERLTDNLNNYTMPSFPGGGFNAALYTSNGYAVIMPDIKYKLNDPGMSAVACVVPAVQAAIATGIVDGKNVAIHGHSWGGYQTAFLITQTNIFKAAAAGAPLTNMISMYSLIYWNSGGTNQAIFEASQGRLTPGYWDNWDAFARNSPVYHIKKVQTPLLLLHNDKDGAVDYTQGIEYYNGLRRLNKPVVMITYKGENHGIAKLPNRKDYAVRMMEYFDFMLKGKQAPDWWAKGISKADMEKHLEARAFDEAEN